MRRAAALALAAAGILLPLRGANSAQDTPPPIRAFDIPTMEKFGREIYGQDQTFSIKLEAGYQAQGLVCSRMDIVPSPNDYKIVQAGLTLQIIDKGTGYADRMGKLELVNEQVRFEISKGDPLTDDLAARVKTRLESFQNAIQTRP